MTSGKTSKRRARERVARMRAEQRRRERRRNILFGATIAAAALAMLGGVGLSLVFRGGAAGIPGVQSFSRLARAHVARAVSYPQRPPVGGPHSPVWLNCGIYTAPVCSVSAVHSLEHGAVWVTYRPDLPTAAVSQLRSLVREESPRKRHYVILSPYPGLPASVVASAWGRQLRLASASDPRLPRFITTYAQGPQTPEPGAACSGGTGTPMP
jgi:hypothetical protein